MRALAGLLATVAALTALGTACSKSDTPCEPITLSGGAPLAAAGEASCPPAVSFDGKVYFRSSESVPASLVGGCLRFDGPLGAGYSASPIKGVSQDEAIALELRVPGPSRRNARARLHGSMATRLPRRIGYARSQADHPLREDAQRIRFDWSNARAMKNPWRLPVARLAAWLEAGSVWREQWQLAPARGSLAGASSSRHECPHVPGTVDGLAGTERLVGNFHGDSVHQQEAAGRYLLRTDPVPGDATERCSPGVDPRGIEPLTSWLPAMRSTS